jgi:hypothetical protein
MLSHTSEMKRALFIFVFLSAHANAIGQVDKIFVDHHFNYQVSRPHVRFLNLSLNSARTQDTLFTQLEVTNTGRYSYHPIAWHIVDSFLYAIELVRLDNLFVRARLIQYTIPIAKKNIPKTDFEQIKETRKAFNYVQILDNCLFFISERCQGIKKPMYFDFMVDKEGIITIAVLEIDQQTISIFSKSIAKHEQESADNIPLYKWVDTWKTIDTFSTTLQSPFRILKENEKYYVVTSDGTLFEAKDKKLALVPNRKSEPIALVFDKNGQKGVRFLRLNSLKDNQKINASVIKHFAKALIAK